MFARGACERGPEQAPCWSFWAISTGGGEPRKLPDRGSSQGDRATEGRTYFGQTGRTLGRAFRAYWSGTGGRAVFGYPLTEEFVQRAPGEAQGYAVQHFERARFEFHPENIGRPYEVLLGRLAAERVDALGRR